MEIYIVLLLLTLKENGDLSDKIKPLLKTILDNKELLSLYLTDTKTEQKKEEPPPPKEETVNFAIRDFLDQYVK